MGFTNMAKRSGKMPKLSKEVKFSIHSIVLRELARDVRLRYPHLRVEAHPHNRVKSTLFVGKRDIYTNISFSLAALGESEYIMTYTRAFDGLKEKRPNLYRIMANDALEENRVIKVGLHEPNSINKLEEFVYDVIDQMHAHSQDVQNEEKRTTDSH